MLRICRRKVTKVVISMLFLLLVPSSPLLRGFKVPNDKDSKVTFYTDSTNFPDSLAENEEKESEEISHVLIDVALLNLVDHIFYLQATHERTTALVINIYRITQPEPIMLSCTLLI